MNISNNKPNYDVLKQAHSNVPTTHTRQINDNGRRIDIVTYETSQYIQHGSEQYHSQCYWNALSFGTTKNPNLLRETAIKNIIKEIAEGSLTESIANVLASMSPKQLYDYLNNPINNMVDTGLHPLIMEFLKPLIGDVCLIATTGIQTLYYGNHQASKQILYYNNHYEPIVASINIGKINIPMAGLSEIPLDYSEQFDSLYNLFNYKRPTFEPIVTKLIELLPTLRTIKPSHECMTLLSNHFHFFNVKPTKDKKTTPTINRAAIFADDVKTMGKIFKNATILSNQVSSNIHHDIAVIRQVLEKTNIIQLLEPDYGKGTVKNKIVDVGSSTRFINYGLPSIALIPTLSRCDVARTASRETAVNNKAKDVTVYKNTLNDFITQATDIEDYSFNFTDSIYYIKDSELYQTFSKHESGLVGAGTMHIYKQDGSIRFGDNKMGYVSTTDNNNMIMVVDGNSYEYTHTKRFPELLNNNNIILQGGKDFDLTIEVRHRIDLHATNYISFNIIKASKDYTNYHDLFTCDLCNAPTQCAAMSHTHDTCRGTTVCKTCYESSDYREHANKCIYCYTDIPFHVPDHFDKIYYGKRSVSKDELQVIEQPENTILRYHANTHSKTKQCEEDKTTIEHDGQTLSFVQIKGESYVIMARYKDINLFDTNTHRRFVTKIQTETFQIEHSILAQVNLATFNAAAFKPEKILEEISKLLLCKNRNLSIEQTVPIAKYILQKQYETLMQARELEDSILMRAVTLLHSKKLDTGEASILRRIFLDWDYNKITDDNIADLSAKSDYGTFFSKFKTLLGNCLTN